MRLDRYRRASDFLADAGAWLAEREAEHNLLLAVATGLGADTTSAGGEPLTLALVRRDGRPVAAALRTPPYNLLLSEVDEPAAIDVLADDLAGMELPGLTGPPDAVQRFAATWTAAKGGASEVLMEEGIYRASRIASPVVPGEARPAGTADRPLLVTWLTAFAREALPAEDEARMRDFLEGWDPASERQFWLWERDGRPVAVAGGGSRTPNGVRIGPVYTPPEERGHGYASAVTAAFSQWQLDRGRRFCFLYTNLANATANHIYQAIGYERVGAARMVRFTS